MYKTFEKFIYIYLLIFSPSIRIYWKLMKCNIIKWDDKASKHAWLSDSESRQPGHSPVGKLLWWSELTDLNWREHIAQTGRDTRRERRAKQTLHRQLKYSQYFNKY